ncbi:MAG: hypothetical protein Q8P02_02840, partial [Candidatus Micrarchaeota archaeon]|nr:hypothetical protein [Candidatus Micrarchaeota archaeon]
MQGFRKWIQGRAANFQSRLDDLRVPKHIRERLAESERLRSELDVLRQHHAPYHQLEDALAHNFHVQNGLSTEKAHENARNALDLMFDFLKRHSVGMNLREINAFLGENPKDVITTMRAMRTLQELEKNRAHPDRVDWPKVSHLDYHIRMGDMNKIPGGDTADLLHISTHEMENGRKASYYWFHNLDWAGKGLVANTFREISQTFIRGYLKNLDVETHTPRNSVKQVFSALHDYFSKNILPDAHGYFAEGHGGIVEVHHGGGQPAEATMH